LPNIQSDFPFRFCLGFWISHLINSAKTGVKSFFCPLKSPLFLGLTIMQKSHLYKKQQYFLKINYEAKNCKEALLFGELREKVKNRMGQFHNGDKDVDSLSKLDEYTMFNYLYDISLDFGVFTKFFDVIKSNKEEVFKLSDKKNTDPEAYYAYAKKFINENKVLDYIYLKVKEHYLLTDKEEVFNILYNLFKHGAYQTFVSLGAIQVEGLFYDFCSAINGGVRKQEEGTLVNKVDKVFKNNRAQALIYYVTANP
jgi:hypothetical protein